ncbi:MAG TPA: ABC transporter substrate-binding protein [Xanthobacteraceae bacterium]|nr:ABC transporter substrate-binding protein [Xanthobacteraceae bacterium]
MALGPRLSALTVLGLSILAASAASGQKRYDPGASDSEIKIGNFVPYSGPASAYGIIGKTIAAYFNKINADGGINGRKIAFISYDDGYSPPKAVEQARKLVESDEVLFLFYPLGTPSNSAIQKYMNARKVPQLFVATGATKWNDPKNFPWTMGWSPSYQGEGHIYAQYLLAHHPGGKIGVLYQNDDYGKDYVKGLTDGLRGRIPIVAAYPYETSDPTVDSQIVALKASGADIFFDVTTPKFASQAIKKTAEIGWNPVHLLNTVSRSIGSVIKPVGFENAQGILSAGYTKDPTDPSWADDPEFERWLEFMDKYYPEGDKTNGISVVAYATTETVVQVLRQCADNLTRENVMKQAANLKDLRVEMLLPGITINTGPDDYAPLKQMQMMRFKGDHWEIFGPMLNGNAGGT